MELLTTAVVDIAMLAATCRALGATPDGADLPMPRRRRAGVKSELRRGMRAYIAVLARSKRGVVDEEVLSSCRLAAEACMPRALGLQDALQRFMTTEANVLDGLPMARQDLWRLAHLIVMVRQGAAAMPEDAPWVEEAMVAAKALRRTLRRALLDYGRAMQKDRRSAAPMTARGRLAALKTLSRGDRHIAALSGVTAAGGDARFVAQVEKLVRDLRRDWAPLQTTSAPPEAAEPSLG